MNKQTNATPTTNLPRYQAVPQRIFELLGQAEKVLMVDLHNAEREMLIFLDTMQIPDESPGGWWGVTRTTAGIIRDASKKLADIHEKISNLVRDGIEEAV